eukprot:CAMPEP_0172622644 /NCGR_PEP_ID=MMETSP1068-20121228/122081_1 /TAXON_ID=35684 /ORGANISM="Pseudopedinella elastica, Strain CCMP716" /LENGTH=80 /DNA_ID=CAMNT_0013430877 /DNA_START=112 /DNA_END=354 /DNA_ORIENTATION=-
MKWGSRYAAMDAGRSRSTPPSPFHVLRNVLPSVALAAEELGEVCVHERRDATRGALDGGEYLEAKAAVPRPGVQQAEEQG